MDKKTAEKLARDFLSQNIELEVYTEIPSGITAYGLDIKNEFLVGFSISKEPHRIGSSQFVAVSKKDGTVRYIGYQGE